MKVMKIALFRKFPRMATVGVVILLEIKYEQDVDKWRCE